MGMGRGEPIWGAGPEGLPRLTVGSRLGRLAEGKQTAFAQFMNWSWRSKETEIWVGSGQAWTEIDQATGFPDQCPALLSWLGHSHARSHVISEGRRWG